MIATVSAASWSTTIPMLLDREGRAVVELWPLVQTVAPTAGAELELFVFDGRGRHGARLSRRRPASSTTTPTRVGLVRRARSSASRRPPSPPRATSAPPYLGLASFSSSDADRFVGREREIDAFVNRLRRQRAAQVVVGPSGAGKSSFVHAGVVPGLPPAGASSRCARALRRSRRSRRACAAANVTLHRSARRARRRAGRRRGARRACRRRRHDRDRHRSARGAVHAVPRRRRARAVRGRARPARGVGRVADPRDLHDPRRLPDAARSARAAARRCCRPRCSCSATRRAMTWCASSSSPPRAPATSCRIPSSRTTWSTRSPTARARSRCCRSPRRGCGSCAIAASASSRATPTTRWAASAARSAATPRTSSRPLSADEQPPRARGVPPPRHRRRHARRARRSSELRERLATPRADAVIDKLVAARLLAVAERRRRAAHRDHPRGADRRVAAAPARGSARTPTARGCAISSAIAAKQWDERGRPRGLLWRDDVLVELERWRRRARSRSATSRPRSPMRAAPLRREVDESVEGSSLARSWCSQQRQS